MAPHASEAVEIFCSYAHEDESLCDELAAHLRPLEDEGKIKLWHDRQIKPGEEWAGKIDERLETARVILLLVSHHFFNSDFCRNVEMPRALERHRIGSASAIPIILSPYDWEKTQLGKLKALPKDGQPIIEWPSHAAGFRDAAKSIRAVVEDLLAGEHATTASAGAPLSLRLPASIPRPPTVGFVARRDGEGRDIVERLREELMPSKRRLVALWGPGGVGKTTLAVEVIRALAANFAGRVVWTGPLVRADFSFSTLLDEIATQLGQESLRTLAPDVKEERVRALVAGLSPLVVLDNFETIAPDEQARCSRWLAAGATCPALITTRERVADALNVQIAAMAPDEAREFLGLLTADAEDRQVFTEAVRDEIIQKAEANPLVMQWVVAQVECADDPRAVLADFDRGEGDAAERVFGRSFDLPQVGEDGRAALLALSLFVPDASHATLAATANFGDDERRLREAVKRLGALKLVRARTDTAHRLTLDALTRRLARARLSKDERAAEFRQRFVAYFLDYAQAHTEPTFENLDALEREKDNLLSAVDVAVESEDWESVIHIVLGLTYDGVNGWLIIRGYWDETLKYGKKALESAEVLRSEWHIAAFAHSLGAMSAFRGDYHSAKDYYKQAEQIVRRLDKRQELAATLHQVAKLAYDQGEYDEARRLYDESLEINKGLQNQDGIAKTLHQLGILAQRQGEVSEARRLYGESLEIVRRLGDQSGIAISLHQLGRIAQDEGDLDGARRLYSESLEIAQRLGDQGGIASTLHQLATLAQGQGDLGEARRLYNESLDVNRRLGNQSGIAISLHQLAMLAQGQGDLDEARRLYGESLDIARRLSNQSGIASSLHQLGRLAEQEGETAEAVRLYREALEIFERLGSPYAEAARRNLARLEG